MNTNKVLFITGIDTGIGKTYATAFLIKTMQQRGMRIISQKPIQTGCTGRSEDLEVHDKTLLFSSAHERELAEPHRCSYLFPFPASPHLSAQMAGVDIEVEKIDQATCALMGMGYDKILIEGAGGLMVPMTRNLLTIDYIAQRGYPVALVSSGRLGSINHSLLSIEALRNRGIDLEIFIYNKYPCEGEICTPIETDTEEYLKEYLHKHSPQTEWIELSSLEL
ncbi:dethiobiotin synthase [Porphyromonas circumdentaria]|uniref:ATP-dependent dethiobiotin synthetase BioD n=1 Tax=Porphyromonas circumdentaria TaxID=29524 RepID=A0A1T4Q2G5_9PORP|nr:dethiobiotin synthase [Porphyromonas circumdentaria]MBB6276607.1 dethiobiotin synthetase [Porphyromonas circumdentaria]MDO4722995.1 dethiobiotin synthase [Porphyromonas circumdentaria]SJZ98015.1 dethiobiotin synthase [Porphyromonas circumdentaria]